MNITAQVQAKPTPPPFFTPLRANLLQRKCACGGTPGLDGECAECRNKRLSLQRRSTDQAEPSTVPPIVHEVLRSPGQPLDPGTRTFMELRFGQDYSQVRVHTDIRAAESARAVNALAYTVGHDVMFGTGQYAPQTDVGRHLLAHELTHVVQQSQSSTGTIMPAEISPSGGVAELEAEHAAAHIDDVTPNAQAFMELRFGHDFNQVRVPMDARAGDSAGAVNPHELTHTIQHGAARRLGSGTQLVRASAMDRKLIQRAPVPDGGAATDERKPELTNQDAQTCSPLYLQKLCVYIIGGFNGDRSGVETPEEMTNYNKTCREESGYAGPDIELSLEERTALRSPACARGDAASARKRARDARIADALKRSAAYRNLGEELLIILNDPAFQASLGIAIGAYLALWLIPEPIFSKIAAAATTIAILSTGAFSISTIVNLANAWFDLENEAGNATSDAEIEQAAQKFGKRITPVEADLLVFLASLLIGAKLPGPKRLPPAGKALAQAERSLAASQPNRVVIEGPWGRARTVAPSGAPAPPAVQGNFERGALALKIEPAQVPAEVIPFPAPKPKPAPAVAKGPAPTTGTPPKPVVPVVPGVGTEPGTDHATRQRSPFVLRLPRQKAPHLATYRGWLGALQSDPNYERGAPAQLEKWHQELRIGGANGIPASVYERGHQLGFTGEAGERRIRVPDWSRTRSVPMEVDHIIELQVTPPSMRDDFNSIANYELLDRPSNGTSGPLLRGNIAAERAKQVAFDPSAKDRVLIFDDVQLDGGSEGERWSYEEIRVGKQLDVFEKRG